MSLSPDAINQSVFAAALFLALLSVPKLLVSAIWYAHEMRTFWNLQKVTKSKYLGVLTKEGTSEILVTEAEDPKLRLELTTKAFGEFLKYIRDPLIEGITAIAILFFLNPLFPPITPWLFAALGVIAFIVIEITVLAVRLWIKANEILRVSSLQGKKQEGSKLP